MAINVMRPLGGPCESIIPLESNVLKPRLQFPVALLPAPGKSGHHTYRRSEAEEYVASGPPSPLMRNKS